MVAGDHHRTDASRTAGLDRRANFIAGRIDHPSKPGEDELLFGDVGRRWITRPALLCLRQTVMRLKFPPGVGQYPQGPISHAGGGGQNLRPTAVGQRHHLASPLLGHTASKQNLRGTLCVDQRPHLAFNHDRHQLAFRVERFLQQDWLVGLISTQPRLAGNDHQRAFRWVTNDMPGHPVAGRPNRGIVAAESNRKQPPQVGIIAGGHLHWIAAVFPQPAKRAVGVIAGTADGVLARRRNEFTDGHLITGEGAGLVGADHRHRAEGFNAR